MTAPTRPDLAIDTRTFNEWIDEYDHELLAWWYFSHGNDPPAAAEWAEYVCLMWDAQVKYEDELVMGQAW